MSNLYELVQTDEGFQFSTDSGLTYSLYFTKYYLIDKDGDDLQVMSFGFYYEPKEVKVKTHDVKIKNTILHVITTYFEQNKEIGVLFLCDPRDGLGRHRRIVFGQWYREIDMPIEKFDNLAIHAQAGYYTSILVRSDNPLKEDYINAFYRSLEEFFPEESYEEESQVNEVFSNER